MSKKSKFIFLLLLSVLTFSQSVSSCLAESIRDFHAEIVLMPDSSLKVTETIKYDFGKAKRHGIYRQIPQTYTCANGTNALHLEYEDAKMDGRTVMMVPELAGGVFEARLGQEQCVVSGLHKYVLKYRVYNAVGFVNGRPEVYWNVTGNQWNVPIHHASASVSAQTGAYPLQFSSYVGLWGAKKHALSEAKEASLRFQSNALKAHEGLTVAAQYPQGTAAAPSAFKRASWYIADAWQTGKKVPWLELPYYGLMVFLGLFGVFFGKRIPVIGSGGGGFSGGGSGGGGGGSW